MTKTTKHKSTETEQEMLDGVVVRLIRADERDEFDRLICQYHYLHHCDLVGEQLRYVAEYEGQVVAQLAWSAGSKHLKDREHWIGWTARQMKHRLSLVCNNSRFLIPPWIDCPNLATRVMKLCLERLSDDWQDRYGHPVLVAESFVDSQLFRGTCYKAGGWELLGQTQGYGRSRQDYYVAHDRPKQLWVRELRPGAREILRAKKLPAPLDRLEAKGPPSCDQTPEQLRTLAAEFGQVPEFRVRRPRCPMAGLLAIVACASLCGVSRGQRALAQFARQLTQEQLKALGVRKDFKARCYPPPSETTFFRLLSQADAAAVEKALLAWQHQILGPPADDDTLVAFDGKELRHSQGAQIVSAVTAQGRWLGSELVADKSNEIPAVQQLLQRVDVKDKMVILDALHTQTRTAQQAVFDSGGDYLMTVKGNQGQLLETLNTLLENARQASPPSRP